MSWENDQRLVQGWLDSRTPTQYLTVRSGPSSCRLNIAKPSAGNAALEIENRLGTPIERVAICGRDGKFYSAENVGLGAKARAAETTAEKVNSWLVKICAENRPEYPLGADPRDWRQSSFTNSRSYYWYNFRNTDQVEMTGSRLERTIACLAANGGKDSTAFGDLPLLKRGTYLALVPRVPEVELGTDSAREEAGFHVIVGEW